MSRIRKILAATAVAGAVVLAPTAPAVAHVGDVDHNVRHAVKQVKAKQHGKLTSDQKAAIAAYKAALKQAQSQRKQALRAVKAAYRQATAAARQTLRDALAVATTKAERKAAKLAYRDATAAARKEARTGVLAANKAFKQAHRAALAALKAALKPAG